MSGWRSGSGSDGRGSWFGSGPPVLTDASSSSRRRLSWGTAILAITVVAIVAFGIREALLRPANRVLPAPVRGSVLIVPIGEVPADPLAALPADYRSEYGLTMTIAPPIPLEPAAFDPVRGQFAAQDLIASMAANRAASADDQVVIGVTMADLYIRDVNWRWAFALRDSGRLAVVSTARMPNTRFISRWWLLRKMITRQIGFLNFGLEPTSDPYDLMYRDILGLDDLRRLSSHL